MFVRYEGLFASYARRKQKYETRNCKQGWHKQKGKLFIFLCLRLMLYCIVGIKRARSKPRWITWTPINTISQSLRNCARMCHLVFVLTYKSRQCCTYPCFLSLIYKHRPRFYCIFTVKPASLKSLGLHKGVFFVVYDLETLHHERGGTYNRQPETLLKC